MEGKSVRPIVVMLMIVAVSMGMFIGQTSASFESCYKQCLSLCSHQRIGPPECPSICEKRCSLKDQYPSKDHHSYCKLGCAISECTHISTPQDPREDEVEGCVNSCSNKCT
ncbi:hypothetical protein BVC80_9063g90 [Macleaya cordata]|uniref:Thionin-like protein 2 n=1 Tax=Macleaya cordata TaxID=56857 RepID=A0A200PND5_MACCD|nr:hypothetical protein BVC80_9063g90 [Macleaya cordata]